MKILSILSIYAISLIAFFFTIQNVTAQPYYIDPADCISANPELSTTEYKLIANGVTIYQVTGLGDIEIVSISSNLPTTNDIVITVRSFNKGRNPVNDCGGYLKKKKAEKFGFGKAVIRVNYHSEKCYSVLDQEIFKNFEETPFIEGSSCIFAGQVVTYSVCPILTVNLNDNIGIDEYFWNEKKDNFPVGLVELYRSADKSSITFKVTDDWKGGKLFCRFGRCNRNVSSLSIGTKTVPSQSVLFDAMQMQPGQTLCLPTSTNIITLNATAPAGTGYSYQWSTNNSSWTFGTGYEPVATSVSGSSVQLNINESAGEIYLRTVGGCDDRIELISSDAVCHNHC